MNAPRLLRLVLLALPLPAAAAPALTAQLEQAARAQLLKVAEAGALSEPQAEATVLTARAPAPCAQPLSVEALDTRQAARMRFAVRCPDTPGWRYEYVVRGKLSAMVAVAAAPVNPGQPLADEQVTLERRDVSLIPDAIGDPALAAGQTSRRALRAGDVLRSGQLAAPLLVKRGDPVLMLARHEAVEVSTSGEALDAGSRGQVVRVRNSASGQVVRMRVTGAGTVEPLDLARITR